MKRTHWMNASLATWTKVGNAKNAWANANRYGSYKGVRFDDQNEYELIDLTETYYRLEGLCK